MHVLVHVPEGDISGVVQSFATKVYFENFISAWSESVNHQT